jgi:hypothetical protein
MWVRSAFWTGRPKPGSEALFRERIDALLPKLRVLPGVRGVRALWPRRLEDTPPDVYCQILVEFAGVTDIDAMLASPGRKELRGDVKSIAAQFDGAISHIDYESS